VLYIVRGKAGMNMNELYTIGKVVVSKQWRFSSCTCERPQ